jgi:hypothetical protein
MKEIRLLKRQQARAVVCHHDVSPNPDNSISDSDTDFEYEIQDLRASKNSLLAEIPDCDTDEPYVKDIRAQLDTFEADLDVAESCPVQK